MKIEISGNKNNPSVLVIGVFHGDEPQGDYLIRQYLKQTPETNILFIPCLNKSGFEAKTRVNANGVDLNRNFPASNWILGGKDEYFGGNSPASEEETKFVINTVEKFKPKYIVTLHAPYKTVNYDGGEKAQELAAKISEITGYLMQEDIGYPTPGSFGTWAGIEKQIPVITLELDEEIEVKELETPVFKVFKMLEGIV